MLREAGLVESTRRGRGRSTDVAARERSRSLRGASRPGRDQPDAGERQDDAQELKPRDALSDHERREDHRHDRVERGEHRGDADEPAARRSGKEQVAERVAQADADHDQEWPPTEADRTSAATATSTIAVAVTRK